MHEENYWTKAFRRGVSRRNFLRSGALAGLGLASLYGAGCTETQQPRTTTTPGTAPTTAPTNTPAAAQPKYGGTLKVIGYDPLGFDPHDTSSYRTHTALGYIYNTVLEFPHGPTAEPGDFTPGPGLAEKWEQADDTTFIFSLRPGVKWHNKPPLNGRPFDGEDIKYTIERMVASTFPYKDMFEKVTKIEVPSKDKVKFTLSEPFAPFLTNLANYHVWMIAKEVADKGADFKKPEWAIGTGPFMLESYEPNVKTVFKKNPDYWVKGQPYVDEVQWVVMADAATQLASLRAGNLDAMAVGATEVDNMKKTNPELQWYDWLNVGGNIMYYRTDKAPFNDVRVRRAIAMGIDRQAWLDAFFNGKGAIDNGPPLMAAFKDWKLPTDQLGPAAQWYKYDPAQAKKLLAEAGYANGLKIKLDTTNGYGQSVVDQAEAIKDFLSKIGIDLTINVMEYATFIAIRGTGNFDEMQYGSMTPLIEVDDWTYGMYHSGNVTSNRSHVNDKTLDALLEKQRKQYNKVERKKTIDEIQKYAADQCYYFYAPIGITNTAWQPWLKNYRPHAGYTQGNTFRYVWLDKSK